jgi:hypothetical protein
MASSVFHDPRPVYFTSTGQPCAGGSLKFFATGTTNPQDVYSDADLSTNIGAVVALGSDGRSSTNIFTDDSLTYRAQLFDANGSLQFDVDPINPAASSGNTIPDLIAGYFLSNDGTQPLWDIVRQLPDPTGQANKIVSTDGTNFTWIAAPSDGAAGAAGTNANVTVTPTSVKWNNGSGNLFFIQTGTGSAPASGIPSTGVDITFPVAFNATPVFVKVTVTSNTFANEGKLVNDAVTTKTATGFSVKFDTNTSSDSIISAVPFDWIAFGTIGS